MGKRTAVMISPGSSAGLEQAAEEIVGGDLAPVGHDGRVEREHRGRIVGGGIVVGDASRRACRDCAPPDRRYRPASAASAGMRARARGAIGRRRHGAVMAPIVSIPAVTPTCPPGRGTSTGRSAPSGAASRCLMRRQQRHAAGERTAVRLALSRAAASEDGSGLMIGERAHLFSPPLFRRVRQRRVLNDAPDPVRRRRHVDMVDAEMRQAHRPRR